MMYIKKPIPIQAIQFNEFGDHPSVLQHKEGYFYIETLEGNLKVEPTAWILGPGAAGEFWAVRDDIFQATYEPFSN